MFGESCRKTSISFADIFRITARASELVHKVATNCCNLSGCNLSRSNLVYQFTCPCCNSKYIGKTDRCLSTRLTEHGKPCTNINNNNSSSSISQHLSQCEHAKYIINMHNLYSNVHDDSQKQHMPSSYTITNLIFNHTKILHSCRSYSPNILLYLEALYIKYNHPKLNCGLKASKARN